MAHGRDHEEREQKVSQSRSNNTPDHDTFEAEMLSSGRHHGVPKQYVAGSHEERQASGAAFDEEEPVNDGSSPAPTKLAEERERERHRLEQELGRTAAGLGENRRDHRDPGVTREDLDRAAREADEKVAGHAFPSKKT
jgi:hypothetical protein